MEEEITNLSPQSKEALRRSIENFKRVRKEFFGDEDQFSDVETRSLLLKAGVDIESMTPISLFILKSRIERGLL